ncbi:hypothetical protein F2Q70_00017983 [Brassica cretica]|uniref:Uncharacterized protein n=1 Tax=Brassica cretica TaxID=69181 RepID=A0A8S9I045_BRACR|nr:hypothetical protein F2Q70_00017983 [Brassica cretica]
MVESEAAFSRGLRSCSLWGGSDLLRPGSGAKRMKRRASLEEEREDLHGYIRNSYLFQSF